MKKIISMVIVAACVSTMQAQYVTDAIRYSQNFPTLSARSMAMGGAFTSLGGDFSSTYINPAGLGLYRKSEFTFSPEFGYSKIKADYLGESNTDTRYQFTMGNAGYVGTYNSGSEKGLVSASYAIGYNRLNNFNSNAFIRGINNNSSFTDAYVESATASHTTPENLFPYTGRLFFDAWLIDTMGGPSQYTSLLPVPLDQMKTISTKGGIGQWSFSFGLNFSNVLYAGASLGVSQLQYNQQSVLSEFNSNSSYVFRSFDFTENLDVKGAGFSFKAGLIARLTKGIRLGASLQLPTFYNITETYYNTVYSQFDDSSFNIKPTDVNGNELGDGKFKYKLNTPMKAAAGISFQLGKAGIISGDVEYVNYDMMKMRTDADYNTGSDRELVNTVNSSIGDVYRPVLNMKLGGELRLGNFSVRAGGGYYPSPYAKNELNKDASYTEITTGIGFRDQGFFFDLGFSGLFHKEKYNLYTSNNVSNIADLTQPNFRFVASMGFRF